MAIGKMNNCAAPINAAKYQMNNTARRVASAKAEKMDLIGAAKENIVSGTQAKAGAKLVKTADEMLGTVLDLKA